MDVHVPGASHERFPVETYHLTPEMKHKAAEELFEDYEARTLGVEIIRKKIKEIKEIQFPVSDAVILQLLRCRKFDIDRTFYLCKTHFKVMRKVVGSKGFTSMDSFPRLYLLACKVFDTGVLTLLPDRDDNGCIIAAINIGKWNSDTTSWKEVLIGGVFIVLLVSRYPMTQIAGGKLIFDFRELTMTQLMRITPKCLKWLKDCIQGFLPLRLKEIHILNSPTFFALWTLAKVIIPKKITDRIHLHGMNPKTIQNFMPPRVLPKEFSGNCPAMDYAFLNQLMEKSESYLTEYFRNVLEKDALPT